jgi:hypothetical protein
MAKSRSWKMERASVNSVTRSRPRSNKYRKSDSKPRPGAGTRNRVWVGGYTRADGSKVHGHYRAAPAV